jgi:uroporphyrinogen-III synthase
MRPLVIVRPEPGASATAEAARKLGLHPLLMPLFSIEPMGWSAPAAAQFDALLFTSANALRHGGRDLGELKRLPAYCVGEATAAASREHGLTVAAVGSGGVDALLGIVPPGQRLLHLCGADWREPAASGTGSIEHLPVYRSVEVPPPAQFRRIEGAVVVVHSPRAAAALSRQAGAFGMDRSTVAIAAISAAAAEASGSGWQTVESAAEPTDAALLAIAARLCNNRH